MNDGARDRDGCPGSGIAPSGCPVCHDDIRPDGGVDYRHRVIAHVPPWGGLTVADVILNNLALGLFLVAFPAAMLRPELFAAALPVAFVLSWLILMADLVLLIFDLGSPLRFHHMLRTVRPLSPMWVGVWGLSFSAFFMTLPALWGLIALLVRAGFLPASLRETLVPFFQTHAVEAWLVGLAFLGMLPVMVGLCYKGVLFSATSRPMWKFARWFPAYLTSGAVLLGAVVLFGIGLLAGVEARPLLPAMIPLLLLDMLFLEGHLIPLFRQRRRTVEIGHGAAVLDGAAALCFLASLYRPLAALSPLGVACALLAAALGRYAFVMDRPSLTIHERESVV